MADFNTIFNAQSLSTFKRVNDMARMIKASKNPTEALKMATQNNEALAGVFKMCEGRSPKEVFYEECEKKGVNPDEFLAQFR